MSRPRPRCGTHGGFTAHKYRGETPCRPCVAARAAYQREYAQRHRPSRANPAPTASRMPETRDADLPCRQYNPEFWFSSHVVNRNAAKAACTDCPIIDPCLAYALQYDLAGVWGGQSQRQRRAIQKAAGIQPISILAEVGAA